jgi:hypothetical protein
MNSYLPSRDQPWERRYAEEVGVDATRLREAVVFAVDHEVDWPMDLSQQDVGEDAGQWAARIGQFRDRGSAAGVVLRGGYIIAEWGDVERVDLTYSATKSVRRHHGGFRRRPWTDPQHRRPDR